MKQMKFLPLALLGFGLAFTACNKQQTTSVVTVTWEDSNGDTIYTAKEDNDGVMQVYDTLVTDTTHTLKFDVKVDYPQQFTLYYKKKGSAEPCQEQTNIFIDGTPVTVNITKAKEQNLFSTDDIEVDVKGSEQQDILTYLQQFKQLKMFIDLGEAFGMDPIELEKQRYSFDSVIYHYTDSIRNCEAATYIIRDYMLTNCPLDSVEKQFNNLTNEVKASELGLRLEKKIELAKSLSEGGIAPNFEVPLIDGKKISLESLRGNYVILDFWASWCGPCRREVPNLKAIYERHKEQGLKILSVSLDEKEADWRKAVKEENMDWLQGCADGGFTGTVGKAYDIQFIPYILVLDKEGKIIARNLRGEELAAAVDKLFEQK